MNYFMKLIDLTDIVVYCIYRKSKSFYQKGFYHMKSMKMFLIRISVCVKQKIPLKRGSLP